ncbi:MAG: hypothetical protein ACOCP4_02795 [Candidatus Woesearchaeota archaeon]
MTEIAIIGIIYLIMGFIIGIIKLTKIIKKPTFELKSFLDLIIMLFIITVLWIPLIVIESILEGNLL